MVEIFREDPAYAVGLLNDILSDGDDQGELLVTLRQMTKAFGGVARVAEQTQASRTQLYNTLSEHGNPELRTLVAILQTLGLRLAVQPIKAKKFRAASVSPRQRARVATRASKAA